jgi:4-aminobutyrate aminotransferase
VARAVIATTGRPRIIAFNGAYHGGTSGSMAISGHPAQQGVAKAAGLTLIPYPNSYRDGGEASAETAAIDHFENCFQGRAACEVAALFIEPIQSDGGMIVPPRGYFKKVEALCRVTEFCLFRTR